MFFLLDYRFSNGFSIMLLSYYYYSYYLLSNFIIKVYVFVISYSLIHSYRILSSIGNLYSMSYIIYSIICLLFIFTGITLWLTIIYYYRMLPSWWTPKSRIYYYYYLFFILFISLCRSFYYCYLIIFIVFYWWKEINSLILIHAFVLSSSN